MIEGLDHYNLSPADLERSRRFYVEVLGLEEGPRPQFRQPGAWLYAAGHPLVHLSSREAVDVPHTGRFNHIAFGARGLAATIARLERCGVAFEIVKVPPMANHPRSGGTQIFLTDPDNIAIELQFAAAESAE